MGRAALPHPGHPRRRHDLALPLRPVRLDDPLVAAVRVPSAADRLTAVPRGILFVLVGHIGGLVVPQSWTDALGISEDLYHFNALFFGAVAGMCTLGGIAILIYRRRPTGPVFMATTRNDKLMYAVLVAAIVLGLWTTLVSMGAGSESHNYRETVSPWFRSLFVLQPDVASIAAAPIQFHIHALVGMLLFGHLAVHPTGARRSPRHCTTCSVPTSTIAAATRGPAPGNRRSRAG